MPAHWSSSMILALGVRGPGVQLPDEPCFEFLSVSPVPVSILFQHRGGLLTQPLVNEGCPLHIPLVRVHSQLVSYFLFYFRFNGGENLLKTVRALLRRLECRL